jgi:AcrR family transcriptional regulator
MTGTMSGAGGGRGDSSRTAPLRVDAQRNLEHVLRAAREVFGELGYGAPMEDVARRARVGVGTVYRRFPNKELLIDALFEERIGEVVTLARAAAAEEDAWRGLARFLEGAVDLLASDRGLRELVLGSTYGADRIVHARSRIKPQVDELVVRAQAQGKLRSDVGATDVPLLLMMLDKVVDTTRDVDPLSWRRALAIVLDGLAAPGTTPLPGAPLEVPELERAIRAWRP